MAIGKLAVDQDTLIGKIYLFEKIFTFALNFIISVTSYQQINL